MEENTAIDTGEYLDRVCFLHDPLGVYLVGLCALSARIWPRMVALSEKDKKYSSGHWVVNRFLEGCIVSPECEGSSLFHIRENNPRYSS